jgi:hypothetical protein
LRDYLRQLNERNQSDFIENSKYISSSTPKDIISKKYNSVKDQGRINSKRNIKKHVRSKNKEIDLKENSGKNVNSQVVIRKKRAVSKKKKESKTESKPNVKSSYKKIHLNKNGKKLPPPVNSKLMEEYKKVLNEKNHTSNKSKLKQKTNKNSNKIDKFLMGPLKRGNSQSNMTKEAIKERKKRKAKLLKNSENYEKDSKNPFTKKAEPVLNKSKKTSESYRSEQKSEKIQMVKI